MSAGRGPVLAIGKFDALHVGHRALVAAAARLGAPRLLRFDGMAAVLGWQPREPLLDAASRREVMAQWSESGTPVDEWGEDFAVVRALDLGAFLDRLRSQGITAVVVGADFHGGHERRQSAGDLVRLAAERGLGCTVVDPVLVDGRPASSSWVRDGVKAGDVATAARVLGRPYRLIGTVVRGDGRGGRLGIPTANLAGIPVLIPAVGVYAATATVAGATALAVVNVGRLPTVGPDRPLTVEAHLLDWSGECYDATMRLDLTARLREERRFPGLEALVGQIHHDIAAARALHGGPAG